MLSNLRNKLVMLLSVAIVAIAPMAVTSLVAADADITGNLCGGTTLNTGNSTCDDVSSSDDTVNSLVTNIVNIFSWIVGVVAVIMIIVGGFRYITSGGDSNKVGGAKTTIIYAIIGLVIVALAQFIVKFVLSKVVSSTSTT